MEYVKPNIYDLLDTMKKLGDATSRNLAFSYRADVPISYGEQTITETNLLELTRRHPDIVHLRIFSNQVESKVGADWEWFIIGRARIFAMRVQAKRVSCKGILKIRYTVGKSDQQQRDLLVKAAQAYEMRPMYCIYCTKNQQERWRQDGEFETGCLFVDAEKVSVDTRSLRSIENVCLPWHHFISRDLIQSRPATSEIGFLLPTPRIWDGPYISDLNDDTKRTYNFTGVMETNEVRLERLSEEYEVELLVETVGKRRSVVDRRLGEVREHRGMRREYNYPRGVVVIDVRSL